MLLWDSTKELSKLCMLSAKEFQSLTSIGSPWAKHIDKYKSLNFIYSPKNIHKYMKPSRQLKVGKKCSRDAYFVWLPKSITSKYKK